MPSPFSKGAQVSDDAFEAFNIGELVPGVVASGTGAGVITGLGFTPDWVLFEVGPTANALSWVASGTTVGTLTLTGRSTTTAATISYIAGNVS